MARAKKTIYVLLIVIAALLLILIITPFFIDADRFRPEIQQMLSEKLGRQVEIGHLSVSLISESLQADRVSIADDPAYSRAPFVTAKSLAVGVDVIPLLTQRELRIRSFELGAPQVQLLRTPAGQWNFATLGAAQKASGDDPPGDPPAQTSAASALNNLTVGKVKVSNGTIAFGRAGERTRLAYQDVNITAENVSQTAAFPLTFDAKTPGGGKLNLHSRVGPFGNGDANRMPFEGQVKADNVPAQDVQNLLAVLGYSLPQGSSLKGGTIKADLAVHGPLERMVTDGPVELNNVTLAGFSLASKLAGALGQTGAPTGNDTLIQLASSKLRYAPEGLRADDVNVVIPMIGSVTGAGTVGANNSLDFRFVAKLTGTGPLAALTQLPFISRGGGLPFRVEGTTSKPEVVPDIGALGKTPPNQLANPQQGGGLGGVLGGLLKKKPPPKPQ